MAENVSVSVCVLFFFFCDLHCWARFVFRFAASVLCFPVLAYCCHLQCLSYMCYTIQVPLIGLWCSWGCVLGFRPPLQRASRSSFLRPARYAPKPPPRLFTMSIVCCLLKQVLIRAKSCLDEQPQIFGAFVKWVVHTLFLSLVGVLIDRLFPWCVDVLLSVTYWLCGWLPQF